MSVWTLIVERNRNQATSFSKPWEKQQGFEAHVMYGPPDSKLAWEKARDFLKQTENKTEPEYRIIGMMKGNFENNFYPTPGSYDEK